MEEAQALERMEQALRRDALTEAWLQNRMREIHRDTEVQRIVIDAKGSTEAWFRELERLWKCGEKTGRWLKEREMVAEESLKNGTKEGEVSNEMKELMEKVERVGEGVQIDGSETVHQEVTSENNYDQPTEKDLVVKPQDDGALDDVFWLFVGEEVEAADMVRPEGSGSGPEQ